MDSTVFDIEYLQKLTYERSKTWSSFLDFAVTNETLEEIDINEFDEIYAPDIESDTNDELAFMEDDESDETKDVECLSNTSNASLMSLLLDNKTSPRESKSNEENQLIDIYNQTLPIIIEHNRQLKESGFDKILRTFDRKKIEDKVGSWLNRHNSLFGGDNTLICATNRRPTSRYCKNQIRSIEEASNDSDDSLQSGETARYIRSSRAGVIKNSATTTTVIKTFRKVKSNQEALHDAFRHVNKISNEVNYHYSHYNRDQTQKSSNYKMHQFSLQRRRRKVLRKRTCDNSYSTIDSSSDSDYCNDKRRCHTQNVKPCCSQHYRSVARYYNSQISPITTVSKPLKKVRCCATKMPLARGKRFYCYLHSQSKSLTMSSSSTSFGSLCENRPAMKRNSIFCNDDRPCKRESECHCCSEKKLCEEYKHVADSSNEWYVENCSPKKLPKSSTSNLHKRREVPTDKLSAVTETAHEDLKTVSSLKTNSLNLKPIKFQITNEKKPKPKLQTSTSSTSLEDAFLTDDDWEFQMVIKASKESYENEQNSKLNKDKEAKNKKLAGPLRKTSKKQEEITTKNKNIIRKDDQIIDKFPKLVKHKNNEMDIVNLDEDAITTPVTMKLSLTNNENSVSNTTKETFLSITATQTICNSNTFSSRSQASKDSYEKEQNSKLNNKGKEGNNKILSTKSLRKTSKKQKLFVDQKLTQENSIIKKDDKIIKNIPIYLKGNNEVDIVNLPDNDAIPTKPVTSKRPITSKEKSITNTREETFFSAAPTQTICNSTALSSRSQAYNRQIGEQFKNQDNEEKSFKSKVNKTKMGLEKPFINSRRTKNVKQNDLDMITEKKYNSSTVSEDKSLTQKVSALNAVTSTTLRSPKINSNTLTSTVQQKNEINCSSDENDCTTLVTSTTNVELSLPKAVNEKVEHVQPHSSNSNSHHHLTRKRIVIYDPESRDNAPVNSFSSDDYFTITKDHLSSVIGEKFAEKFIKYYIGRKRFNKNATIYYIPPTTDILRGCNDTSSESDDELENLGMYGDLYESLNKAI